MTRILIVDDQEEVRTAFARALALDGYETFTAEDADTAIQVVKTIEPDAILLDLVMPVVNGLDFLHRLRATHPRTPVAVITGKSDVDEATVKEILSLGAHVRFKPISIAQIHTVARELLTRRQSQRAGPDLQSEDSNEAAKQAVEKSRKAADAVYAAALKARARRALKKR